MLKIANQVDLSSFLCQLLFWVEEGCAVWYADNISIIRILATIIIVSLMYTMLFDSDAIKDNCKISKCVFANQNSNFSLSTCNS